MTSRMAFRPQQLLTPSSPSLSPSCGTPFLDDSVLNDTTPGTPATTRPSSAVTSPTTDTMEDEALVEELKQDQDLAAEEDVLSEKVKGIEDLEEAERLKRLDFLLQKSSTYASLLHKQMDLVKSREKVVEVAAKRGRGGTNRGRGRRRGSDRQTKKRKVIDSDEEAEKEADASTEIDTNEVEQRFHQPELVTGGTLKDYQLDGVAWMVSLYENGISGILADEMGLGKTLQTIAFCAYLRQRANRPFMVVCPLSTLHNWMDEFHKFAPEIPVCMYHGTPEHRAEMRRTTMRPIDPQDGGVDKALPSFGSEEEEEMEEEESVADSEEDLHLSEQEGLHNLRRGKRKRIPTQKYDAPTTTSRRTRHSSSKLSAKLSLATQQPISLLESDDEEASDDVIQGGKGTPWTKAKKTSSSSRQNPKTRGKGNKRRIQMKNKVKEYQSQQTFPVVVTTYEIIIKDRKFLGSSDYDWGYIVVDEGHRLKNMDCKLVREIKQYKSACRLILTGTPLHNNLGELWSLLNFILPDIFDDLHTFQQFFNIPKLSSMISSTQTQRVIAQLHSILKPFLLRRLKVDVEYNLPPKKEYILYAPLTEHQKSIYEAVVNGAIRRWLIDEKSGASVNGELQARKEGQESGEGFKSSASNEKRTLRKRDDMRTPVYDVDFESDRAYFSRLEKGELNALEEAEENRRWGIKTDNIHPDDVGQEYAKRTAVKQVNNLRLQNVVMQLRKVCSHPFLFNWPIDPLTGTGVINDQLIRASGKMLVLERLLDELFRRGHRVLLFSQLTTMLDIIEDWAVEFKGWCLCRIDGSTKPLDRRDEMKRFQESKDEDPNAPKLFLLSTRAGGLGINLTRADTVIFYDQDWNPQMDMQAQDRAHRIGQTKPVLIFRLVTAHTIETTVLQRATEKRKLEALVIAKGKFKVPGSLINTGNKESLADFAASLLRLEGEKIDVVPNADAGKTEVISDRDLNVLLDRSPEVFQERTKGWKNNGSPTDVEEEVSKGPAFEVFESTVPQGDALSTVASDFEDNNEIEELVVEDE